MNVSELATRGIFETIDAIEEGSFTLRLKNDNRIDAISAFYLPPNVFRNPFHDARIRELSHIVRQVGDFHEQAGVELEGSRL